ncbi:MAG: hypothetical protein ACI9QQ_002089, partial [Myxococcota bacterium]
MEPLIASRIPTPKWPIDNSSHDACDRRPMRGEPMSKRATSTGENPQQTD